MASLYPREKTARLNAVHAWWPGGLVVGGLLGVAMSSAGIGWQAKLAVALIPMFLALFLSMFLTAASELAPGQWVDFALSRKVHMPGILLLVYVSGLMFIMRHFAGPLVQKLSPMGLLWMSCLGAALGLFALSIANSRSPRSSPRRCGAPASATCGRRCWRPRRSDFLAAAPC